MLETNVEEETILAFVDVWEVETSSAAHELETQTSYKDYLRLN